MGNFIANIEFAGLKMFVDHHKHTVGKLFMLVCDVLFQDSPLSVNTKTCLLKIIDEDLYALNNRGFAKENLFSKTKNIFVFYINFCFFP